MSKKKKISYRRVMDQNPTELGRIENTIGQEIIFYEHPILGDESTIIIVFDTLAFDSGFYDLDDLMENIDYMPFIIENELYYGYEV